ncbi:hypothetical protein KEM55_002758 [Ascosphaera atra]|nr:hypothetical protein KEM55_002758 [Ascosphaera atra]
MAHLRDSGSDPGQSAPRTTRSKSAPIASVHHTTATSPASKESGKPAEEGLSSRKAKDGRDATPSPFPPNKTDPIAREPAGVTLRRPFRVPRRVGQESQAREGGDEKGDRQGGEGGGRRRARNEKAVPISSDAIEKQEMGIVLGKPVVRDAIRKTTRSVAKKAPAPLFVPSFPNKQTSKVIFDKLKLLVQDENYETTRIDPRPLLDRDDLDAQNAKLRAKGMLPDYRILRIASEDLVERLVSPETCTSSVLHRLPPYDRCLNRLFPTQEVAVEAPRILEELRDLEVRRIDDWPAISYRLKRLADLSLCRPVHARQAKETLQVLDIQMAEWPGKPEKARDLEDTLVLLEKMLAAIPRSKRTISMLRRKLGLLNLPPAPESPAKKPTMATADPVWSTSPKLEAEVAPPVLPSFSKYLPHTQYLADLMHGTRLEAAKRILTAPLQDRELEAKYMYIYWFKHDPSTIKIGVTNDVQRRLRSWRDNCGHADCEHSHDERLRFAIKHAYRVEKLVHAWFKEERLQTHCDRCANIHIEWFQTTVESALEVIGRYAEFMDAEPYAYSRETGHWQLKQTEDVRKSCAEVLMEGLGEKGVSSSALVKEEEKQQQTGSTEDCRSDIGKSEQCCQEEQKICLGTNCRIAAAAMAAAHG